MYQAKAWGAGARRVLLGMVAGLGFSLAVSVQAAQFDVLVDGDNQTATGCTVATSSGNFAGAEYVFSTTVDTSVNPAVVTGISRRDCQSGSLGSAASVDGGGWSLGMGLGSLGYDVLETYVPATGYGLRRVGFAYTDVSFGSDSLLGGAGGSGGPIMVDLGVAPSIPSLGSGGLFLLSLILATLSVRRARRAGASRALLGVTLAVLVIGNVWAAMVLDGQIGDWAGSSPVTTGSGSGPQGASISAIYTRTEGGRIYVRADIRTAHAPRFTSAATASLGSGVAGDFVISTSGIPLVNQITLSGSLPPGLSFSHGAGSPSAHIQGTPTVGASAGNPYVVTLTAANGVSPNASQTLSVNVVDANVAPSFVKGANPTVGANSGAASLVGWATGISPGPAWESGQTVSFVVTSNSNPGLFSQAPAVAANGTLSFTPATGQTGTATLTLVARDNGGTANGGQDTSAPQTFLITLDAVPSATNLSAPESYTEHSTLTLTPMVVSDTDSPTVTATLTLPDPAYGSLSTGTSGAVTATYSTVTGVWTASGPIANVNALLANVVFTPTPNFSGSFNLATRVSDGVVAVTGSKTLTGNQDGTTVVTSLADVTADDGLCSLREAVLASNTNTPSGSRPGECPAGSDAHSLVVHGGTANFSTTGLTVSANLSISCPDAGATTLKGLGGAGLVVSGGTLQVSKCLLDAASLTLQTGTTLGFTASGGSVNVSGSVANSGSLTSLGNLSLTATTGVTNVGTLAAAVGVINVTGDLTVVTGTLTNQSTLTASGNITVTATTLVNGVAGGDSRTWVYNSNFRATSHTDSWYSFPDNYETEYHDDYWTNYQYYVGGAPGFVPTLSGGGVTTLQGFTSGSNLGGLIHGSTVTLIGQTGATFVNNPLALNSQDWVHHYEYYTHYAALGPATYEDHVLRNDSTTMQATNVIQAGQGGVTGTTINNGGFTL